jgi:hypothetical protein
MITDSEEPKLPENNLFHSRVETRWELHAIWSWNESQVTSRRGSTNSSRAFWIRISRGSLDRLQKFQAQCRRSDRVILIRNQHGLNDVQNIKFYMNCSKTLKNYIHFFAPYQRYLKLMWFYHSCYEKCAATPLNNKRYKTPLIFQPLLHQRKAFIDNFDWIFPAVYATRANSFEYHRVKPAEIRQVQDKRNVTSVLSCLCGNKLFRAHHDESQINTK